MMGCLFELILFPFELILDIIFEGYISIMQWIIPERYIKKGFKTVLKVIVWIISIVLLVILIIGLLAALHPEVTVFDLWKLIFVPLAIILVQIILGVIVRFIVNKK